jgi:electron transfer flavoprotein beta subunit
MKIAVLIKAVPDFSNLSVSSGQGKVFEKNPRVMNGTDRVALEAALQIKDKTAAEVSVFLLGRAEDEKVLREALAVGADQAHHILSAGVDSGDSFSHAVSFGSLLQKIGPFDLILCGHLSEDGIPSQMGPRLAEYLNLNQVTQAREVSWVNSHRLEVKRKALASPFQEEFLPLLPPCLITLIEGGYRPRIPNAIRIMKTAKAPINQWESESLEKVSPAVNVLRSYFVE